MPNFNNKFQVLLKICRPLFHRHVFTSSKLNDFKTFFNTSFAHFLKIARNINQAPTKRLIYDRRKIATTSLAVYGFFSWDENRITNDDIKKEVVEMMNVLESASGDKNLTEMNGARLKIDFEASRSFQVFIDIYKTKKNFVEYFSYLKND